jgi:enoyl-CoA hydratase/carnithine racemase
MSHELERRRRDGAVILTLARPARSNALSRSLLLELGRAGAELATDADARAVVLTGAGERAFCAGADLKERAAMSDAEVRRQLELYRSCLGWLGTLDVPVVAAVNGAALGGGLELALCCDLRVAASNAVFGLPETSLGIIPGAGGTQRLPRVVGLGRALEMTLLGRRVDAATALAWGLVHEVVSPGADLVDATLSYLAPVLEGAPLAQRAALRAIREGTSLSLSAGLELERAYYEQCLTSADRKEALAAFAERRRPKFQGR